MHNLKFGGIIMRFTKFLAVAGAISMLASAIPFAVSADETDTEPTQPSIEFDKVTVGDQVCAVIKNVTTADEEVTIPATVTEGENEYSVIGVSDYAFVLCENLNVVNVPDSLTIANTGNVAFLTSSAISKFLDAELASAASFDDVLKYVADKAKYKNGNYTDADIADLAVKLRHKLNKVDISAATTVEGKLALIIKNIDKMELSQANLDNFNLWISSVKYDGFKLKGNEGIPMQEYATGKEILGMVYEATAAYVLGDADGNGRVSIADCRWIALRIAKRDELPVEKYPAADYNKDGKISIRDAADIAKDIAKGVFKK